MSLLAVFQKFKSIRGLCPCCGKVFRLSDATLFTRGKPPKTPFDRVEEARQRFEELVGSWNEERGELQEAANRRGDRQARRWLRRVAPIFKLRGTHPKDVKALCHPVDYIAFCRTAVTYSAIVFLDRPAESRAREAIQTSLEACIQNGNLEWQTWRVSKDGVVQPCSR